MTAFEAILTALVVAALGLLIVLHGHKTREIKQKIANRKKRALRTADAYRELGEALRAEIEDR